MSEAGGEIRYLRLRADTLMGMFRELPGPLRVQALAALAHSASVHGGDSARRYFESEAGDATALLAKVRDTAAELGWGTWRFAERGGTQLVLEVDDSPFASGYGASDVEVCAPIAGMLEAVAGLVLGARCEARETECAARGAARCRFEARAVRDARTEVSSSALSEEQRAELRARLAHHRANPDEPSVTLADIAAKRDIR